MQGQGQAALLHGGNYGDTALHSLDRPWCTPRNMGERCRGRLQHTHRNANITEILASEKYPILKVMAMTNLARMQCWVTRLDVTQEIEKWAESAALASPAHCAHFYVSCAASYPVTQYNVSLEARGFSSLPPPDPLGEHRTTLCNDGLAAG